VERPFSAWTNRSGALLAATAPNADVIAVAQGTELEIGRLNASTGVAVWRKSTLGKLWVSSTPYDGGGAALGQLEQWRLADNQRCELASQSCPARFRVWALSVLLFPDFLLMRRG
jgi:hypothetical protein